MKKSASVTFARAAAALRGNPWFFLCALCVYLLMLVLNFLTPMIADDYTMSYENSIFSIVPDTFEQYMTWGGRSVGHLLLRFFLLFPLPVFNIVNAGVFMLLCFIIYRYANPAKKYNIPMFLFVFLAVWVFVPDFGQVMLWRTGSCNYMWGVVIILAALWPIYRSVILGRGFGRPAPAAAGMFVLGLLGGWCNENTSGAAILLVLGFIVYAAKVKKKRTEAPMITALAGFIIGFLFMALAPGNAIRGQYFVDERNRLVVLLDRLVNCNTAFDTALRCLIYIFVILFAVLLCVNRNRDRLFVSAAFFVAALASNYAMALSPTPGARRAMIGSAVFLVIACAHILCAIPMRQIGAKLLQGGLIALMGVSFFFSAVRILPESAYLYYYYYRRDADIVTQVNAGVRDIKVLPIPRTDNSYHPAYGLDDLTDDPKGWINYIFALTYGVDSVTLRYE